VTYIKLSQKHVFVKKFGFVEKIDNRDLLTSKGLYPLCTGVFDTPWCWCWNSCHFFCLGKLVL